MKKLTANQIKEQLFQGKTIKANGWSINITAEDKVAIWPPKGDGFQTSLAYVDKAVKDFLKSAEGMPAPKVNTKVIPQGDTADPDLGKDSTEDVSWGKVKVNTQPKPQGQFSTKELGEDSTSDEGFKSPSVNTRPMPPKGRGGLPNTDLGKDTTTNIKWAALGPKEQELVNQVIQYDNVNDLQAVLDMGIGTNELVVDAFNNDAEDVYSMIMKNPDQLVMDVVNNDDTVALHFLLSQGMDPMIFYQEAMDIGANKVLEFLYTMLGGGPRNAKIVDTFEEKVDRVAMYKKLLAKSPSKELLSGIGDPDYWAAKIAFQDDDDLSEIVDVICYSHPEDAYMTLLEMGIPEEIIGKALGQSKGHGVSDRDLKDLADAFGIVGNKEAVAPPGWEGTVKKMKEHPEIDNPFALAWSQKNKGDEPHYTEKGKKKEKFKDSEEGLEAPAKDFSNLGAGIDDFAEHGGISYKGSAKRVAGPRLKENWGDGGAYSRDMEAETAEELHALVRAFGGEEVDWSSMRPQTPQATQDIMANKQAVDEAAKNYYEKYYKDEDYGKQLVKDVLKRDRQMEKEEGSSDKKEDKKEAQMAPAAPQAPGAAPKPATPPAQPGAQTSPVPGPGVTPPAGKPSPAPPGTGDSGLLSLGWTNEDIQLMTPEEKQKVLQVQLNKPGTKKGPGAAPQAPAPKAPGAPGMPGQQAPGAGPAPAPKAPGETGVEAPEAGCKTSSLAERLATILKIRKAQQELNQPMAPVQNPVPAPTGAPKPDVAAPAGEPEFESASPQSDPYADMATTVFSVYSQIRSQKVQAASPEEVATQKAEMFISTLLKDYGINIKDAVRLLGAPNSSPVSLFK